MKKIKNIIIDRVIESINSQITNIEESKKEAEEESKAHKGAMASRYDTFKEEAQYLSDSYAGQLTILGKDVSSLRSLKSRPPLITKGSVYAIIELESVAGGKIVKYFLLPAGGGDTYIEDGEEITILNTRAPLAKALIGISTGSLIEVTMQKTKQQFKVKSII